MKDEVWIVYPLWNFDEIPCLSALATAIAQRNKVVRVFAGKTFNGTRREETGAWIVYQDLGGENRSVGGRFLSGVFLWIPKLLLSAFRRRPILIIGVAQWGLFCSGLTGWLLGTRVAYLNTELQLLGDRSGILRRGFKRLEAALNRRCEFSIIQDSDRADALSRENRISRADIQILPNSSLCRDEISRTDTLRRMFSIAEDRLIVLYLGGLVPHFLVLETILEFRRLPSDFVLVIHSPDFRKRSDYAERVQAEAQRLAGKVFVSSEFLQTDDLLRLVASADVGLAYFSLIAGNELNDSLVGHSSGKIAHYLRAGVPVVTSNFDSLRWVEERECGVCTEGPKELCDALGRMRGKLDPMRERARVAYREVLAPERFLEDIARRIDG